FLSADRAAHLVALPFKTRSPGAHLRAGASAGRRKRRHRRLPALPPHPPGPPAATMSASAVFILDVKGKREEEGALTPLLSHGRVHFLWIKYSNLYLVATTLKNANASLVYSFLYKIVEVFSEYFKELEEESIRDNFVIVYELLDELMDFGFPQTTDSKILQEYITQQGNKLETGKSRVPPTVTNAVSWRSEGIKYKKNEVFIDVIESVNLLVNANGSVLLSEIVGTIKLKVFLSGMPELRLGLNDRVLFELTGRSKNKSVELEDVKFHQCVRLSRFDNDRTISFIPPDGDFELMSYRLSTQAKGQFKKQSVANGVEISVPVPSDADSPRFKTSVGSAKYVPEKNMVIWSIKSFPGGKEYLMRAHFGLPSVEKEEVEGRPPIGVKFEIPYFTVSGIQVREGGRIINFVPARREKWGLEPGLSSPQAPTADSTREGGKMGVCVCVCVCVFVQPLNYWFVTPST
ncbi:AP1M2, partial [Cervus elaphus hippelaphus]